VAEADEFDERNPVLLVMLGLVALADDALAPVAGAAPPAPWAPPAHPDDGPLLR
jgi:hypothetical protein